MNFDYKAFCMGLRLTTAMVIYIQMLYMIKVNPDASLAFQQVCGSLGLNNPPKTQLNQ